MKSNVYFDDSLGVFVQLVVTEWGESALIDNLFLRDVSGRLTFIVREENYSLDARVALAAKAHQLLGSYVDGEGYAVATPDELFDDRLKSLDVSRQINVEIMRSNDLLNVVVNIVDRRMVGGDWLRELSRYSESPKRIVFASIKGGVGRSTSLCVLAASLASQGKRVLTVDMDLEAPGLGNMLLSNDTLPEFGLLDYLVEQGISNLEDQFYVDMISSSWLTAGNGRIDVIPAIGRRSLDNPANVLAKIARAYLGGNGDEINENNEPYSFTDSMRKLLDRFNDSYQYDVILIDARAGLHETTATAIIGLGASVLFFGIDQPQTFSGYELLFAHLNTMSDDSLEDWRNRITFVQAKAPGEAKKREKFSEEMSSLLGKFLLKDEIVDQEYDPKELSNTFEVEWTSDDSGSMRVLDKEEKEIQIITVLESDKYNAFDPLGNPECLKEYSYKEPFQELISFVFDSMAITQVIGVNS